jgi:hypothetical protein
MINPPYNIPHNTARKGEKVVRDQRVDEVRREIAKHALRAVTHRHRARLVRNGTDKRIITRVRKMLLKPSIKKKKNKISKTLKIYFLLKETSQNRSAATSMRSFPEASTQEYIDSGSCAGKIHLHERKQYKVH